MCSILSVEIKEINEEQFGKCLSMNNGVIEAVVTIDFGPRIIKFGLADGPNMLYQDAEKRYTIDTEELRACYGAESRFHLYGGHRLWISPERNPESYYPDNEPVVYSPLPDGVRFIPPRQRQRELQLSIEIMMNPDAHDIMVVHCAQNISKERTHISLWGITALQPGGTMILPQNTTDTGTLANRSLSFWPYSQMDDRRFFLGNRYITLTQDAQVTGAFKLGVNNHSGWCAYARENCSFIKRYVHIHDVRYPDFGSSFEAYTNGDLIEMETLSPIYAVEPKEMVRHVENWSVFSTQNAPHPRDEEAIERFVNSL